MSEGTSLHMIKWMILHTSQIFCLKKHIRPVEFQIPITDIKYVSAM